MPSSAVCLVNTTPQADPNAPTIEEAKKLAKAAAKSSEKGGGGGSGGSPPDAKSGGADACVFA